jgi:hypothetical protein
VTFIVKLLIVPRVSQRGLRILLQLLDQGEKVWDLATIPGEWTCSQSATMKEREKRDPSSSYFLERASTTTFYFPFL